MKTILEFKQLELQVLTGKYTHLDVFEILRHLWNVEAQLCENLKVLVIDQPTEGHLFQ